MPAQDPSRPSDSRRKTEPTSEHAAEARRAVELARSYRWVACRECSQDIEVPPGADAPELCRRHDVLGRWS